MTALRAQDIFEVLHDKGLSVSLGPDGSLLVKPKSSLTDELRVLIRGNKTELLDWLQAANDPNPPLEPPADPKAWRELAVEYHAHHFGCLTCIAAGRGVRYGMRCGTGAALWTNYQTESQS